MKKPILQMIRSASTGPALQQHPHALMKKRWLRVARIVIAVFLVLLIALPFLINVNSFSKSSFITAESVEVVVELVLAFSAAALMPLIFSTPLNVTRIALNETQITLLKAPNGVWKISSLSTTGVAIGKAMAHLTGGFQTLGETEVVNLRLVITQGVFSHVSLTTGRGDVPTGDHDAVELGPQPVSKSVKPKSPNHPD